MPIARRRPGRARCAATVVICVGAMSFAGCASLRGRSASVSSGAGQASSQPPESLASYISRTRALASVAKPAVGFAQTIEATDPKLSAALLHLIVAPAAESHRRVAWEYKRLHVLDMAHRHFTAAVKLDPTDAEAFDGLARIWRDWGFPNLGLGDAYRAVHLAPEWPVAANTLGTLLEAVGQTKAARGWYARALSLEPAAPYALNNLCYASVMLSEHDAVAACQRAVDSAPDSRTARNNLALAHAASGDFEAARQEFRKSGTATVAHYNTGIVYMAARQYHKAVRAFDEALRLDARSVRTADRARQARLSALGEDDPGDQH